MMRRFIVFITFFGFLAGFGAADAAAEENLPSFSIPSAILAEDVEILSPDFNESFQTIENGYLSDMLKLNYQISLLEKMVERQAALGRVAESFESMGVSFEAPPPPRGICIQLPVNAPCLKAYPDMYSELVSERKAYYDEQKAKAEAMRNLTSGQHPSGKEGDTGASAEEIAAEKARLEREEKERKEREAKAERRSRYLWTDVSCLAKSCRGVLVSEAKPGFRATVREGTRLDDGTYVQDISTDGIRIAIDGDTFVTRPADASLGDGSGQRVPTTILPEAVNENGLPIAAGVAGEAAGAGVSADNLSDATANVIANAEAASVTTNTAGATAQAATPAPSTDGATGGGGQTVSEPPLGPSGLF